MNLDSVNLGADKFGNSIVAEVDPNLARKKSATRIWRVRMVPQDFGRECWTVANGCTREQALRFACYAVRN